MPSGYPYVLRNFREFEELLTIKVYVLSACINITIIIYHAHAQSDMLS